jgi:hypothetical protein
LVHALTHPGRNARPFVIIAAALVAVALFVVVLAFTVSDQGDRGGASGVALRPPRVESPRVTSGQRTAAHQNYLDRLYELNTTPQERASGQRTAAHQNYLDRLYELNDTP